MTNDPFKEEDAFEGEPSLPENFAVDLTNCADLVEEYRRLKSEIAAKEDRMKIVRRVLESEMGLAELGLIRGEVRITWKARTSKRFNATLLKERRPDIYAEFSKSVSPRYFIVK